MSIELHGARHHRLFSMLAWRKLLELARQYGWEPSSDPGPDLADNAAGASDWAPGRRQIGPADAAELADALACALPHVPPYEVTVIKRRPLAGSAGLTALADATGARMWSPDPGAEPIEFFSGRLCASTSGK
ncbi:MAG: hypothetical protein HGA45_22205 [Chloroflexales bacterium]|nr:hypothetical protein [Chloroflexales bacterium]